MANRRGQQVQVGDFNPRPLIDAGSVAIARPDGSEQTKVATALGGLADEAGKWADQAAKIEGKRAGDIAGNDPAYRPTGSTTIRGAASDEAGTASYLNNLDARVRTRMTDIFQQHENDPVALKGAIDQFKAEMTDPQKGDVFPEIQSSFNASFERLRLPFQIKALDNLQTRQREESRASAIVAGNAGETVREQVIRAAPDRQETRQAVEATLAEDDHRDQLLVRDQALTADQAAARSLKRRRDAEATIYEATADRIGSADAVKTYRDKVQQEFSDGKTKLDADGWIRVDASLQKREQQLRAQGRQVTSTVSGTMDAIVKQYSEGIPSSPAEVAAVRQKAQELGDEGQKLLRSFDGRLLLANVAKAKAPAELDQLADGITSQAKADGRGLTTEEGERVQFLRSLSATKRQQLATDPLSHARREGLVDAPPLVVPVDNTATGVAVQIVPRIAAAKAAAATQGGPVRYFTQDDRELLKNVGQEGGDRALAMVKGIVQGAGADAPAILREIGGDMPELAKAGDLIVNGGPGAGNTAREITKALELRKVKDAKLSEPPTNAPQLMREEFGSAYLNNSQSQAQIMASAKAIFEARAFGKGIDPKSSEGQTLYKEALRSAAGQGKVDDKTYGGVVDYKPGYLWNYKVAIPPNVRSDRFRDVVQAIRDEDLAGATDPDGKPISARDVRGAIPVRVKGGYAFSLDDPSQANPRFLGKPGAPLVLDLEQMGGDLVKRVPGAYLGGEH